MAKYKTLVAQLLDRGDLIEIINGVIAIQSASSLEVPPKWMKENRDKLIHELLVIAGVDGYIYNSYTTGSYSINGGKRADGITLIFESILTGNTVCATYNANLKRSLSTKYGKAGAPLPKGHFSVSDRYIFYKFWKSTGLSLPRRLSSFHDYMGNLKGLIFSCEVDPYSSKVKNKIIPLLTISTDQLLAK